MGSYISFWKRGLDFEGVSTVEEYWSVVLIEFIMLLISLIFWNIPDFEIIIFLYMLVSAIPKIALSIRRLHDINKSGYYLLLYFLRFCQ